jgi:hypothetical protein
MSKFIAKLQSRLAKEESGFTLIELLIVSRDHRHPAGDRGSELPRLQRSRQPDRGLRERPLGHPAAEAYYSDNGDYNFTLASLKLIDAGIKLTTVTGGAASYTLMAKVGNKCSSVTGPGGNVAASVCP